MRAAAAEGIKTGEKMVEPFSGLKKVMNNRIELAREPLCKVQDSANVVVIANRIRRKT